MTGAGGRLGRVVAQTFTDRGDTISHRGKPCSYMVFTHRYRGVENFAMEMVVNVEGIANTIDGAIWEGEDRAIVVVSSVNADTPAMNQSLAYNCSKSALNNLARMYKLKQKVRINTVSPDTFTTDTPRVSKQQVANVIAFLCSPQASGINGEDIKVRG